MTTVVLGPMQYANKAHAFGVSAIRKTKRTRNIQQDDETWDALFPEARRRVVCYKGT
jgi:hypothetical protein